MNDVILMTQAERTTVSFQACDRQRSDLMTSVSIDQAQANLAELVDKLAPGEEVVLTRNDQPVARLIGSVAPTQRQLGTMRGTVIYMAPDFDAPLHDFEEYAK